MRTCWRPKAPGELDHELLWLSVSLGGLALASIWFALHLPWPRCVFLAVTGHPCATCGATRATVQFLHGNFTGALKWNPLFFVFLCGVTIWNVYAAIVLLFRRPRLRVIEITRLERQMARIVIVSLLAVNWIYLLRTWNTLR